MAETTVPSAETEDAGEPSASAQAGLLAILAAVVDASTELLNDVAPGAVPASTRHLIVLLLTLRALVLWLDSHRDE